MGSINKAIDRPKKFLILPPQALKKTKVNDIQLHADFEAVPVDFLQEQKKALDKHIKK